MLEIEVGNLGWKLRLEIGFEVWVGNWDWKLALEIEVGNWAVNWKLGCKLV